MAEKKDDPNDPIIGREWGNYVVDSKIGEGGMGAVYRLVHKTLPNTFAALKVLSPEGAAHASARERFEQEARVAAVIGKERVAAVRDHGTFADGIPYIVMDLVDGQNISALLRETGPLRVMDALQIAYDVAETLMMAHGQQIIHRDIKPSNLMVSRTRTQNYAVTILDWGIAKARGELQVAHTGTAAVAGTLGYMAPETMAPNAKIDGRVDVFSLGVTLFEMLAGHKPYMIIATADQIAEAIEFYRQRPVSIGRSRPPALDPVPRWLERIVLRALLLDQTDRPTMDKFLESLAEAIARLQKNPENRPQPARAEATDTETSPESSTPGQSIPDKTDEEPKTTLLSSPPSDRDTRKLVDAPTTALMPRARRTVTSVILVSMGLFGGGLILHLSGRNQPVSQLHPDLGSRKESTPVHMDLGSPLGPDSAGTQPTEVRAALATEPRRMPSVAQPPRSPSAPQPTRGPNGPVRLGSEGSDGQAAQSRPTRGPNGPVRPSPKKCKRNAAGALICP